MKEKRDSMDIISDLNKITLHVDDLTEDGEFRINFEFPKNHNPDLKSLTALRELFCAMEDDLYLESEPLDDDRVQVHGYIRKPYRFESNQD